MHKLHLAAMINCVSTKNYKNSENITAGEVILKPARHNDWAYIFFNKDIIHSYRISSRNELPPFLATKRYFNDI